MTQTDGAPTQLETLRGLVTTATQRLLGDTISVSDEDWRGPSRLPEWSRGHVATHIARHADGIVRLTEWARTGERQDMYASAEQRAADIEEGSGRTGLELQIDLDTSAGRLGNAFEALDEAGSWDAVVELRGGMKVPARLVPLTRLLEVVVHHVDLDIGFEFDHIETTTAEWLLEWCAFRLRDREFPKLELTSESGFTIALGTAGETTAVNGTSANLLGWVMGRLDESAVSGAEGLHLPAY